MNITKTQIEIQGKKYNLINGTQSDGRCYSASIFYDLNKKKAEDKELNDWIQIHIIETIISTQQTNCPLFMNWVGKWYAEYKKGILPETWTDSVDSLQKLEHLKEIIQNEVEFSNSYVNFKDNKKLADGTIGNFLNKYYTQQYEQFVDEIDKELLISDKNKNYDKNSALKSKIESFINFLCPRIIEKNNEIISEYKKYIELLNKPNSSNGYEWTEPNYGPAEVLTNSKTLNIKRIHLYDASNKRFYIIPSNENDIINKDGREVFLYYIDQVHYQPLEPLESSRNASTEYNKEMEDLKKKLSDLNVEIQNKTQEVTELKNINSKNETTLKKQVNTLKNELEIIKKKEKEIQSELEIKNNDIKKLNDKLLEMDKSDREIKSKIKAKEALIAKLNQELKQQKSQTSDNEKQELEITKQKKEIEELKRQLVDSENRKEKLLDVISNDDEIIKQAEQLLAESQQKIKEKEMENTILQAKITELSDSLPPSNDKLKGQLLMYDKLLAEKQLELEIIKKELEKNQSSLDKLSEESDKKSQPDLNILKLQKEMADIKTSFTELSKKITDSYIDKGPLPSLEPEAKRTEAKRTEAKRTEAKGTEAKGTEAKEPVAKEPESEKALPIKSSTNNKGKGISKNDKRFSNNKKKTDMAINNKDSVNQNDKKNKKNKKDEKIPNSLIIYIKTRIPNFYKLTYEPFMTVPNSKSHTVYFDPLVKYYEGPIKNIPNSATKNTIYTQFFEASEFDTMINRILSDFRYMQKPRSFEQAYNEGIIDNNIEITLNNLFRRNNILYLNKQPYSIVNKFWTKKSWDIDKKPIDKLLSQFSNLTVKQLEKQAKEEEDDIPEVLRQGNLAAASLSKEQMTSSVASGLKEAAQKPIEPSQKQDVPFISLDKLSDSGIFAEKLYSKYLKDNSPINYSNSPDIITDPLTLSLLVEPSQLLEYINNNQDSLIISLYQSFMSSKEKLLTTNNEFKAVVNKMAPFKKKFFDSLLKKTIYFDNYKKTKQTISNPEKINIIKEITELKVEFIKFVFELADAINKIYELQRAYFISLKLLLEELKTQYVNIIKYYETPSLALECIQFDINNAAIFIDEDPENVYSRSYFAGLKKFTAFYEDKLYTNQQQLLNPQINYIEEFKKYTNYPDLLLVEFSQFELYEFKFLLYYLINQIDIWVLLLKSIEIFSELIKLKVSDVLLVTEQTIKDYDNSYNSSEQSEFLKRLKVDGVRSEKIEKTENLSWFLVKKDGLRCITPLQTITRQIREIAFSKPLINNIPFINKPLKIPTGFTSLMLSSSESQNLKDLIQERKYIETLKQRTKAYDAMVLYIYILEILCLRQHSLYVSEENINHLNLEYTTTLYSYYNKIQTCLEYQKKTTGLLFQVPESLLFDTSQLNDETEITSKQRKNNRLRIVYKEKIKALIQSRKNLDDKCQDLHESIDPTITNDKFLYYCNSMLEVEFKDIPDYSFQTANLLQLDISNYDLKNTQDFMDNIISVVKDAYSDFIIDDDNPQGYLDWIVYKNDEQNANNKDLSLLSAICYALNGELDISGNDTTNKYATMVDGKLRFTIQGLQKLIEENSASYDLNNFNNELIILQEVLKIKFIVFEMFPRSDNSIQLGDIVLYLKNNKTYRVTEIDNSSGNNLYTIFDGKNYLNSIPQLDIQINRNNLQSFFRLNCYPISDETINDYIYLVEIQNKENMDTSFEFVSNTYDNKYIYNEKDIPIYMKYFIYNNCFRFDVNLGDGFNKLELNNFTSVLTKKADKLNDKLQIIETNLKEKMKALDILENKMSSAKYIVNEVDQANKIILEGEIDNLEKERKENIKKKYGKKFNESKYNKFFVEEKEDDYWGGQKIVNPREQYLDYSNMAERPYYPQPYPSNYHSQVYPPPGFHSQGYNPNYYSQGYPPNYPPGFNKKNRYYPYNYTQSYKMAANKAKDTKSKLAFYINIELELYPGKSANSFQRSVVRCQSTFERIREAYAEIFGYQYRPAAMKEAYGYNYNLNNKNNEDNKDNQNKKTNDNKTTKKNYKENKYNQNKTIKNR